MVKKLLSLLILLFLPQPVCAGIIDIQIKGIDDGIKTTKQQDYKKSVLFAKRQAIERAGVKISSKSTVKNLILEEDYIESKSEALLLPGYQIIDVGYDENGNYVTILIGKIQTQQKQNEQEKYKSVYLDVRFFQNKMRKEIIVDQRKKLNKVLLGKENFEIRVPKSNKDVVLQICAWTDDSIFKKISENKSLKDIPFLKPGTGIADGGHTVTSLVLNRNGNNYLYSDRLLSGDSKINRAIFSKIRFNGKTTQLSEWDKTIFMVIFMDFNKNKIVDRSEFDLFELVFL
jgi:hypothetical protein